MKKYLLFFAAIFITAQICLAAVPSTNPVDVSNFKLAVFIKFTPSQLYKLTGQKLTLKEKINLSLLKSSMKKQLKKNSDMTVGEYFSKKRETGPVGSVMLLLLGAVLLCFVLFMVLYKP